jgi:hypothetical protein
MLGRLSSRNNADFSSTLGVGYDHCPPVEESNRYKARLIISKPCIFQRYGVSIEQGRYIREIDAVFAKVGFAFGVVPFVVHGPL